MTPSSCASTAEVAVWERELCREKDLPESGEAVAFGIDGRMIGLFNANGRLFAVDDTCTHRPSSLSEDGLIVGTTIECGWHGSCFDLETGVVLNLPACEPLRVYRLRIVDGRVFVAETSNHEFVD